MKEEKYNAIIIYGPTASGKSRFGVELAKQINGEIINCDSTQIYKDLPIITAQPTEAEMQNIPHHLYGILDQNIKINAVIWLNHLTQTLSEIKKNSIPIILGGTGLYINSLLNNGLNYIPQISKITKEKVQDIIQLKGMNYVINELKNADTNLFKKISINDTQRILRYFEVLTETGKPISFWWSIPKKKLHSIDKNFLKIYIKPKRETVYQKCQDRFFEMIKLGALTEVENFISTYKDINKTQMSKTIGLTELQDVIKKHTDINTAIEKTVKRTQNYAKRQFTWFNNQIQHNVIIENLSEFNSEIEKIKNILC